MSEPKTVLDFNLNLQFFLTSFQNYKNTVNIADTDTISLMETIIKNIDTFFDKAQVIQNKKNVSKIIEFEKNQLVMRNPYINCKICKMDIHASYNDIQNHIKNKQHIQLLSNVNTQKIVKGIDNINLGDNKTKMPEKTKKPAQETVNRKLNRSMRRFLDMDIIKVTENLINDGKKLIHLDKYDTLHDNLIKKLQPTYPNVKIYFFGSRITGLGNETTDLDLFIDINNTNYNSYLQNAKKIAIIRNIKSILLNNNQNHEWTNAVEVLKARTPILKVYNNLIDVDCDLSFTNGLSHCNTQLIKYYLDLQPVCLNMAMFIKTWGKQSGTLNMTSYLLIMMTIFFLQTKNVLPSVKVLQEDLIKPHLIGEWRADIVEKTLKELNIPRCDEYIKFLLIEFFHYYGYDFDFKKYTISPYLGTVIEKTKFQFQNLKSLEMPSYQNYVKTLNLKLVDCEKDLFAYNKPLCVQDPYELIHNIGKGVHEKDLHIFVNYCRLSEEVLKQKFLKNKK